MSRPSQDPAYKLALELFHKEAYDLEDGLSGHLPKSSAEFKAAHKHLNRVAAKIRRYGKAQWSRGYDMGVASFAD